jgi:hypothetical protein
MSVLASRIARASYGVVVQQIYSPAYHFGEDIIHDPYERAKEVGDKSDPMAYQKGAK